MDADSQQPASELGPAKRDQSKIVIMGGPPGVNFVKGRLLQIDPKMMKNSVFDIPGAWYGPQFLSFLFFRVHHEELKITTTVGSNEPGRGL